MSLQQSVELSAVSLTVMVLMNKKHKGGGVRMATFSWLPHTNKLAGKVMKRLLIKSKS